MDCFRNVGRMNFANDVELLKGELRCKMKIGMLKHHTELVCVLRSKIDLACCIQSLTIFYRLSQKANNGSGRCP